jgi:outer membrane protein TolC
MIKPRQLFCASARAGLLLSSAAVALVGCVSASREELNARRAVSAVGSVLKTDLPAVAGAQLAADVATLRPDTSLADYVLFAVYHHPAVRAAYFDWKSSVAAIAPARALPDPQLTFQADIADTLMSLMPGLMFDVMPSSKRQAMAREAVTTSTVAYRTYVAEVIKTATAVRKAWVELAYAQDTHRLYGTTIHAAEQAVAIASAEYATGRGMVNFEQQVRFQNLLAQHHSHHSGVAQQVAAARARFKSALGLLPTDPDPAWPAAVLSATKVPPPEELWERIQSHNADLARMRAMVDMAVAGVDVARQGGTPEVSLGAMVDLKQNPLMFRPTATVTLPIWREKIRANIAAAAARRDAAAARITVEQLNMAAELAQMLSMIRESDSMLEYMNETALPNLDRSLASAEAAVQSGMGSATMIADAQLMSLDMRHERLTALRDRENAVADLAGMMNDMLPEHAPFARQ